MPLKNRSQLTDVLHHLKKYKKITSYEAIRKYGCTRLSSVIHILRHQKGYNIRTEMKIVKNRYEHSSPIAVYHFEGGGNE